VGAVGLATDGRTDPRTDGLLFRVGLIEDGLGRNLSDDCTHGDENSRRTYRATGAESNRIAIADAKKSYSQIRSASINVILHEDSSPRQDARLVVAMGIVTSERPACLVARFPASGKTIESRMSRRSISDRFGASPRSETTLYSFQLRPAILYIYIYIYIYI